MSSSEYTSKIHHGQSFPIGPTLSPGGVNFSLFSRNCSGVDLLLFDSIEDTEPARIIRLHPQHNHTYHYWHVFVSDLQAGQLYGYRITGPCEPQNGHRYDREKILLDPYAKVVAVPGQYKRDALKGPGSPSVPAMKGVVADLSVYQWEDDKHPGRSYAKTIIYEMHVGGFTKNHNSGVPAEKRGTFAGLVDKVPYLVDLGITAVELMPVFQFDQQDCPHGLVNYWGYSPVSFFALHQGYSSDHHPLAVLDEFRDMVKALHHEGIEVILDVVFNHTAEGDENGPTYGLRGIDNSIYYLLEKDKSKYSNYTGTGNTLNANHPIVRRMIIDSLHFWVEEMHVDGFRFDLASVLARDETGNPLVNPPVLWDIESDPVLSGTKLIAEAWDAAGLYQVGSFTGDSWREWNGRFRDDVRGFLKGNPGTVAQLATRMMGSPDLYGHKNRDPEQSINFVTCHDGFTLNDLVTYNEKHNEANGENNRDGSNDNLSFNYGVEGPTQDEAIEALRSRQIKNFFILNMQSLGAPMLLMGDEVRRTQGGNNNCYCHDSELSWFDWNLCEEHADLKRFVKLLIQGRLQRDASREEYSMSLQKMLEHPHITWHGIRLHHPDWSYHSHSFALCFHSLSGRIAIQFMINAYWAPLEFDVPAVSGEMKYYWKRWIDTWLKSPEDIGMWQEGPVITDGSYTVQPHAIAVLVSELPVISTPGFISD
jgi:isoamylase